VCLSGPDSPEAHAKAAKAARAAKNCKCRPVRHALGLHYHGGTQSQRTGIAAFRALWRRHGCCLSGFWATDEHRCTRIPPPRPASSFATFAAMGRQPLCRVENGATEKQRTAFEKLLYVTPLLCFQSGLGQSAGLGESVAKTGVGSFWLPWREHSSRRKLMKCVEDSCCGAPAWLPGLYVRFV
jgi:hypothetical protein